MKEAKVTVKIPRPLYDRIQEIIADSGFSSATDFIVFVLRDLVGDRALERTDPAVGVKGSDHFTNDELEEIRRKLQNLGYL